MSKSLKVALRLQRDAAGAARRHLVKCLLVGFEMFEQEQAAQDAILKEAEASTRVEVADIVVEAFVAWLPRAKQGLDAARYRRSKADAATAVARAALYAALALEAGIVSALERRTEMEQARVTRAFQKVSEEAAQRARAT